MINLPRFLWEQVKTWVGGAWIEFWRDRATDPRVGDACTILTRRRGETWVRARNFSVHVVGVDEADGKPTQVWFDLVERKEGELSFQRSSVPIERWTELRRGRAWRGHAV